MTKILDIQKSISAANGNVSLAKDLFTMLLNELESRLEQIENSFNANDLQALGEHTHKLYGATAYCIVPGLRKCTGQLEDALKHKTIDKHKEHVEQIKSEIQKLIQEGPAYLELDWKEFI
jgi:two-component system sensor histidine kinase BarA